MCRHLARIGPSAPLGDLLFDAPHSLHHQSHAPRHQLPGLINADGWGVGWWDRALRAEPARYRTATPMWADRRFREMVPLLHSRALIAAARNASPGAPIEESGNAPFTSGPWLFSHNGYVEGFRSGLGEELRREIPLRRAAGITGSADSEVVFGLLLTRIDAGDPPAAAVASLVTDLATRAGGRFNLLLGDGEQIVATRWGSTLFVRTLDGATVVASEPTDDAGGWNEVPDQSLLTVTDATTVAIQPLA